MLLLAVMAPNEQRALHHVEHYAAVREVDSRLVLSAQPPPTIPIRAFFSVVVTELPFRSVVAGAVVVWG